MFSGRVTKIPPPFPPLSKDEGLRDIGHIMSIGNLILDVNNVAVSYLIRYDSLLQNVTDIITKCDSKFITKCHRSLLENASGFLLQNATILLQCNSYYKLRQFCYKVRQLLQNATFITNCDSAQCSMTNS